MEGRRAEQLLLVTFCALAVIPLLYLGRASDTNTFTSWRWVLSPSGLLRVFSLLVPCLLCAFALSRLELSGNAASAALFVASFASALPLWLEPEAIIDASRYFVQAKSLEENGVGYFLGEWGRRIPAWTDLPLVPFLDGLVFSWIGEERTYIQALNTLLFALTVVLTSLIGKRIWDEETGLHAGLLLLGIPYLLTQVPLLLVDVPTLFFLTLSIYLFILALEKGGGALLCASSGAIFLAILSKYSTWPMLLLIPITAVVRMRNKPRLTAARAFGVMLMTGLLAGAMLYARYDLVREQLMLLRTYQWSGLSRWHEGFVSTFLFQTHPFVTGLALYGIYRAVRERDIRFLIAGWFVIFIVLLQVRRIRYIVPLFPLFSLMASYGLNRLRDARVRRYISLCAVASSLVIAYTAFLPFLRSTSMANLGQAGKFLDTLDCRSVRVYALPQGNSSGSTFAAIPLLDYHTRKRIISPQEWPGHPDDGDTRRSSLRFTWEARRPDLFAPDGKDDGCAVAVISDTVPVRLPVEAAGKEGSLLREAGRFDRTSGVFKYQTMVTVYTKDGLSQTGQKYYPVVPIGTMSCLPCVEGLRQFAANPSY